MATSATAAIHQFDRFVLDLGRGVLLVDGVECTLRPKSFSLLRHFVENANRLIDRDEIMHAVWPGIFVTDDSIAQCISEIRRVLDDSQHRLLRTVPRRGFLFAAQAQPVGDPVDDGPSWPDPPLPDKPSITVLPFQNLSGDPEQEYFADGMVEEIINALTRFPSLFVIASGSSLSYRGRERDFKKIGRELGVRYLLEGSVRRSGQRVRIAVDLVGAEDGAQIWSERFEGTLEDVFALQDEVANEVAARIEPTIQAADLRRGAARPTEDLDAYDLFLRGLQLYREADNARTQAAIALFEQAVARDPTFAGAWAALARSRVITLIVGWTADRDETVRKAQDAIRNSLLANDDDGVALAQVAFAKAVLGGDRRSSLAMADRALTLNPGSFPCWTAAGYVSLWCEQYEQALERFQHSLRLNPRAPDRFQAMLGIGRALVTLERFEEAIPWLDEAITLRPDYPSPLFSLAIALSHLGRIEEAKTALARFEALASLKSFIETLASTGGASETYLPALRRLGADV